MEALATAAMLANVDVSAQVVLSLQGNFERRVIEYRCEGIEVPLYVDYINAAPNFLAIVPVIDHKLVFVATLSGSGVRYVSGNWEFWTKGTEATLTDLTEQQGPFACEEFVETP